MKQKIFSFCLSMLMTFMIVLSAQAQNSQTFSGVVIDNQEEPIIGASIKVVGTGTGTITDLDGKFSLTVPAKGKVEISYLGYASQVISDFSKTQIILQEDALMLEETVVVGYGVQKKAHLTGAISTIDVNDITDLSGTDLSSSLRGLVTGLSVSGGEGRPGSSARLNIRQSKSTTSLSTVSGFVPDTSPLYVIDGFISSGDAFNNLDPTMVESVSVLKDGAAAVYGASSANGVILVTTKRGTIGKPKISYSGSFGFADEISRPKMLNSYDYGRLWNGVRAASKIGEVDEDLQKELFQADELDIMRGLNYDILDREWDAALTQKHSVNVGGGTDNVNYFAGIAYNTQEGNLGNLDYERWNYRAGVDVKISKWVKATLQVSGDYGKQTKAYNKIGGSSDESDYNNLLTRPRYIPEYVDGRPVSAFGPTNKSINESQDFHFDLIQNAGNKTENMNQNMVINSAIEYDFGWNEWTKGLSMKFSYSKSIGSTKNNERGSKHVLYRMLNRGGSGGHLYLDEDINGNSLLGEENFEVRNVTKGNALRRTMSRSDAYQMNFSVNYARTFGDHSVSGLFSIERSESESEDLIGSVNDPYDFTNGQSNTGSGEQSTSFGRSESGKLSYIGRLNYAYLNKYLVEFLVRSDASTKFAPENYWGTFPSLSLGWVASEESWFRENIKFIDHLKLRGSFGLLGRDNTKAWAWLRTYTLDKDKGPIFGPDISKPSGPHIGLPEEDINRDAHWDKSYKSNFGIDFSMLRNRLSAGIDGYYEWNREIFAVRTGSQLPSTVGAPAAAENFASMDNYGVELSLKWADKIGKDFKYSVGVNTGYSDNKVLKQFWENQIPLDKVHPGQRSDTGSWGYECIGMFRSYQDIEEYFDKYNIETYRGMKKGDVKPGMLIYKDVRGKQNADGTWAAADGIVDENDLIKISHRSNPYGLTMNLRAEWKGISLSTQISASWGGYDFVPKYARSISSMTSTASDAGALEFINMPSFWADDMYVYQDVIDVNGNVVAEANHDARYPNLQYSINGDQSTFWKVSGTRVTWRNLTLAYSIPKKLVNRVGLESCRLNLTGQNLLSLYNPYPDNFIDPLAGAYGSYPNLRRFTLGLNVSF